MFVSFSLLSSRSEISRRILEYQSSSFTGIPTAFAAAASTTSFEIMPTRDIISQTAMISAYSQAGRVEEARECFDKMPERNVVTWNSMPRAYDRSDSCEEALKLYKSMRRSKELNPDSITYATAIGACADLAAFNLGTQIVAHAEKLDLGSDVAVANSIVTFYSKCGHTEEARKAFESIGDKNMISWNAIMAGFAQNGDGEMLRTGCEPDHISFVSVLSGCSHSDLVEEGKLLFASMVEDFGISPTAEHLACIVDMLGRTGILEDARSLIESPGFKSSPAVFTADDSDHPMIGDVFTMLGVLIESMKGTRRYSDSVEKLNRELLSFAL